MDVNNQKIRCKTFHTSMLDPVKNIKEFNIFPYIKIKASLPLQNKIPATSSHLFQLESRQRNSVKSNL